MCFALIAAIVAIVLSGFALHWSSTVRDTATSWLGAYTPSWLVGSGPDSNGGGGGVNLRFSSVPPQQQQDAFAAPIIPSMVGWLGDAGFSATVWGYTLGELGDIVLVARNETSALRRYVPLTLDVRWEATPRVVVLKADKAPQLPSIETPFLVLYRTGTNSGGYDTLTNVLLQCRLR